MGVAFSTLGGLANGSDDRQTGDCHRRAPKGISTVLEVEGSSSAGPTFRPARGHRSRPEDGLGESSLRRADSLAEAADGGLEFSFYASGLNVGLAKARFTRSQRQTKRMTPLGARLYVVFLAESYGLENLSVVEAPDQTLRVEPYIG